jgi:hypothetical protein
MTYHGSNEPVNVGSATHSMFAGSLRVGNSLKQNVFRELTCVIKKQVLMVPVST